MLKARIVSIHVLLILGVALSRLSNAAATTSIVIYSNLGPNNSFDPHNGTAIQNVVGTQNWAQAMPFMPGQSFTFDRVDLAVAVYAGNTSFDVWLMTDSKGLPGNLMEHLQVVNAPFYGVDPGPPPVADNQNAPIQVLSAIHPLLQAHTQYWIAVAASQPLTEAGWFFTLPNAQGNSAERAFFTNNTDGTWIGGGVSLAFEVLGTPSLLTSLFSTYGADESDGSSSYGLFTTGTGIREMIATSFIPSSTATFGEVELDLNYSSGPTGLDVWIAQDSGGVPGAVLESFHFAVTPGIPNHLSAKSLLAPLLVAGTTYWFAANVSSGATIAYWPENNIGQSGPVYVGNGNTLTWSGGSTNLQPVFRVSGTISTCPVAQSMSFTNSGGFGLAAGSISNQQLQNGMLSADAAITNTLRVWLGVNQVLQSGPSTSFTPKLSSGVEGAMATEGLIPACASGVSERFPYLNCQSPGVALWTASLCGSGEVQITLSVTLLAAGVTLLNLFYPGPLDISDQVALVQQLENAAPDFKNAMNCLSGATPTSNPFSCTTAALTNLGNNDAELQTMSILLQNNGISFSSGLKGEILSVIEKPVVLTQMISDLGTLLIRTGLSGKLNLRIQAQ